MGKAWTFFDKLVCLGHALAIGLMMAALSASAQPPKFPTHQLKFSLLRLLNFSSPGFENSYEICYGKFSTQLSVAYLTDVHLVKEHDPATMSGVRLNLEEKFFCYVFKNDNTNVMQMRLYVSLEGAFHRLNKKMEAIYEPPNNNNVIENRYQLSYEVKRKSVMVDSKIGIQMLFIKHLILDGSIGLGVIVNDVAHSNKNTKNPDDVEFMTTSIGATIFDYEGHHLFPNLPISFKFGYAF